MTHQRDFMGISATGKQLTTSGIAIYRIAAGKIQEEWVSTDRLGLMKTTIALLSFDVNSRLGMAPKDGELRIMLLNPWPGIRCLDHVVVFGESHLRRVLKTYAAYYNQVRTHLSLEKDAPKPRRPLKIRLHRSDPDSRWPASSIPSSLSF